MEISLSLCGEISKLKLERLDHRVEGVSKLMGCLGEGLVPQLALVLLYLHPVRHISQSCHDKVVLAKLDLLNEDLENLGFVALFDTESKHTLVITFLQGVSRPMLIILSTTFSINGSIELLVIFL